MMPVDVDRHPGVVGHRLPGADHRAGLGDARRRGHERQPGVGDEHDRRADQVEHQPQEQVDPRAELAPAVVVAVEEHRLEEEQRDVGQERRLEHVHQVRHELRVQQHQHEQQERPEGRRQRERHREQLGELVGQLVVALVAGLVADELDDQREHRHGEHERGEQQVQLRQHPDDHAAADPADLAVSLFLVDQSGVLLIALGLLVGEAAVARRGVSSVDLDALRRAELLVLNEMNHAADTGDHTEDQQSGENGENELVGHLHDPSLAARSLCILRT